NAPMPGRTPTKVPSVTPIRQYSSACGVIAWRKPRARLDRVSISEPHCAQWHAEQQHEESPGEQGYHETANANAQPVRTGQRRIRQQELSQRSGNEPEAFRSQGPEHEALAGADDGPQGYAGPDMHCWLRRTQRSHGG